MPPHCQHHPSRQNRQHPLAFQQLCLPERSGSRQHQNSHRRKRQRLGKFQKQQSARHTAQQGGGAVRPRPGRRDAAQRKGRVVPRSLTGSQRRRQEKADPPSQPPAGLELLNGHGPVFHKRPLLCMNHGTSLQPVPGKIRRNEDHDRIFCFPCIFPENPIH